MTKSNAKKIISEFAADIEGRRWLKSQVNSLTISLWHEPNYEQGRILAYCEIKGYDEPDAGEFGTLEEFKSALDA